MGVAGVGKSTLAQALCRRVQLTYLSTDPITDPFFPETRESKEYQDLRPRIYEALYRLAEENLTLGNSVLLDAPHISQFKNMEGIQRIEQLAHNGCARLSIIRCWCRDEELRRRITVRGEQRDLPKLNNWSNFLQDQSIRMPIPMDHIDIYTEESMESNLSKIFDYLERRD
jgi:predicted kinase